MKNHLASKYDENGIKITDEAKEKQLIERGEHLVAKLDILNTNVSNSYLENTHDKMIIKECV